MAKLRLCVKFRLWHVTALIFILFSWGLAAAVFYQGSHIPDWLGFAMFPFFLVAMLGLILQNILPHWIFVPIEGVIAVLILMLGTVVVSVVYGAFGALIGIAVERIFFKNRA